MRVLSLLIFLSLMISCGEEIVNEEGIDDRIGLALTVDPNDTLSAREVTNLSNICNAISDKEFIFEDRVRTNQTLEQVSQVFTRDCSEEDFVLEAEVTSVLSDSNGELIFSSNDSSASFYGKVLVQSSKQLNGLCDSDTTVDTSTVRYSLSGSYGTWVQVLGNREGACGKRMEDEAEPASGTSFCYVVTTAKKSSTSETYTIQTVELFEVNVNDNNKRGHVVKRSYATSSGCSGDKVTRELSQVNSI